MFFLMCFFFSFKYHLLPFYFDSDNFTLVIWTSRGRCCTQQELSIDNQCEWKGLLLDLTLKPDINYKQAWSDSMIQMENVSLVTNFNFS